MKINEEIFLYADPHFGHKKIIEYENRQFENIKVMDDCLIQKWNEIIKPHNKVLILGDFSFHVAENTKKIIETLNGEKMLIMGNHDLRKSNKAWLKLGFDTVSRYPIIYQNIIFSHEPYESPSPYLNIHAHLHSNKLLSNRHHCVSYEHYNYPVPLKTILNKMGR